MLKTHFDYTNPVVVDVNNHTHAGDVTEVAMQRSRVQMRRDENVGNPAYILCECSGCAGCKRKTPDRSYMQMNNTKY